MNKRILIPALLMTLVAAPVAAQDLAAELVAAVEEGNVPKIQTVLSKNPPLEGRNRQGWTPLLIAAKAGRVDIIELLTAKGADPNARSISPTGGATVLCFAVGTGQLNMVNHLIAAGARPDYQGSNGLTPLMIAARESRTNLFELLLEKGARLERRGKSGLNVLDQAVIFEATGMAQYLINKGLNVNAQGPWGRTPLFHAASYGKLASVKFLLAAGADPTLAEWENNYTADQVAWSNGHTEVQQLLLEARRKFVAK